MGKTTGIEWTQATWNPWMGCQKISPGCKNCYMFRDQRRFGNDPTLIRRSKTTFNDPLKWADPLRIFTCSWSDFFLPEADKWRAEAWSVIRRTPHHTYLILTKRPELINESRLPADWGEGYPNVQLGVSVESQQYLKRADRLNNIPARVRFLSAEPLLDWLDPLEVLTRRVGMLGEFHGIDWVIVGGESDPTSPRPMQEDWVKLIRDTCEYLGIPFFFKQWGGGRRINGVWGGRKLDGRTHDDFAS